MLSGEGAVYGDAGYSGNDKRDEIIEVKDDEPSCPDIEWRLAIRRGMVTDMTDGMPKMLTVLMELGYEAAGTRQS